MKLAKFKIAAAAVPMLLVGTLVSPAFAQISATGGVGVTVGASTTGGGAGVKVGANASATVHANIITKAVDRASQEITRRIDALNKLSTRVNGMAKLSSSDKANLTSEIQSQIAAMNTLQAQISADTSANATSSLKSDIQSITKSYRIFMLIIPQGALEAAADRVLDVAQSLSTLAGQLQTRITAAQNAGTDMSASVTALADMNAKIADANTQANAATSAVAGLKPDNGDQTVAQANLAAMKSARSKVQAAQQDLVAARKDAGTIVKALMSLKGSAGGSASSSATVNASGSAK